MPFHPFHNYSWEGIDKIAYKPLDPGLPQTFDLTDRMNLVASETNTDFHLRYFESAVGGYSSLEKHEHVHVVVCMRGQGDVIVDQEVYHVKPFDLVVIPSWAKHQLVNTSDTEPFGFFCTVNANRDKYQTLTKEEVEELCKVPEVKKAIKVHTNYWG